MNYGALLSFVCGFASLSIEILWVRQYGFAKSSTPAAFGLVLCLYLIGISFGAVVGARACRHARDDLQLWRAVTRALLASSLLTPILPGLFAAASSRGMRSPLLDAALIACASGVLSFCFPLAHHLGTRDAGSSRGRHFARVYTANVAGAALGPLVTGYLLLDRLTLQSSFIAIGVLQALAAILLATWLRLPAARSTAVAGLAGIGALAVAGAVLDPHALLRNLGPQGQPAGVVIENRHGVITIYPGDHDDVVYGGNVYDGSTNLDPVRHSNGLERPLLLAALQPQPTRVLMVGLSIGTWLAVVREFPGVQAIDVIEINPGYLEAARAYPLQAAALRDPRVHVAVDDARRWLRHHPERRYDLVVMNTTLHWRANATLLLSREMLQQLKGHMAPDAVLGFNATGSPDAFFTATQVFAHAYRYRSFVYAADFDFRARKDAPPARATYASLRLDGRAFFPPGSPAIDQYLAVPFFTIGEDAAAAHRPFQAVTDENLLTEFRHGRLLYDWGDLFFFRDPLWLPRRQAGPSDRRGLPAS